jgi:diguanylate cyclase (GGDEF)-like protein
VGAALGFGAPAGSLFLKLALGGVFAPAAAAGEIQRHAYYYAYMTLSTPLVFGLFGWALGSLLDRLEEKKALLERLVAVRERQSLTDDLTGLFNHRYLLKEAEREAERVARRPHALASIMIDIDDFKRVNDRFGHLAGDAVLREVASVLQRSVRKVDTVGRYGGDEFLVLMPDATLETARRAAERIRQDVGRHPFRVDGEKLPVSLSVGVYAPGDQPVGEVELIEKADEALLKAKARGKDRVEAGG